MKILLITEFYPDSKDLVFTGGVEARTYFLAKNLEKNNQVEIISRPNKKTIVEASFLSIFSRIAFIFIAFFKGLRLDFDLVEGSNFVAYLPAYFLGLVKKKPKIAWYADLLDKNWFRYFGLTGVFGWLIEKLSLKLNWTRVIALSRTTKNKLIKAGIKENKIDVVYGGINGNEFKSSKVHQSPITNHQSLAIICISRLVKYKRVEDLIKAFSQLIEKHPDIGLTIVGEGPEEKSLKKLALQNRGKNSQNRIKFLKSLKRKELLKILKESYLFCLPSVVEGFGLVTIEAAACGIPYVISDIEVNREITKNGQGGLIFKKKNINDLKNKIEKLLTDKKLYNKKQKQGLKLARNYDWNIIAEQTKKVYSLSLRESRILRETKQSNE